MSARCLSLMVSLRDSSEGLEGSKVVEIADEIEVFVVWPRTFAFASYNLAVSSIY